MCWSGEASAVLATTSFGAGAYLAFKGESKELWIPLSYFACMEMLQAATYVYIDRCNAPPNQILTFLGYIHIAFQPFFINMVAMYFIPEGVKTKISTIVYTLSSIAAIAILVKMYPFEWAGSCIVGKEGFCGPFPCSVHGNWHIAWQLPLNGLMSYYPNNPIRFIWGLHSFAYILAGFFLPIIYGSWRLVAFHTLFGPILANFLTANPNEYAAVWCLLSIPLCLTVIKTPLRPYLHVKKWPFYSHILMPKTRFTDISEI